MRAAALALSLSLSLAALLGCGAGTLEITARGSAAVEDGLAAEAFADGAAVTFSSFVVAFDDVAVVDRGGVAAALVSEPFVLDLHAAGPHQVARVEAQAGPYERVSLLVAPAVAGIGAGNVDAATVDLMGSQGFSVLASGAIDRDGATTTFSWGFRGNTRYVDCAFADDAPGVVIPEGGVANLDVVVHGEGLFATSLAADATTLSATALLAADANTDGVIDIDELGAVDLEDLEGYDTVGRSDVVTLADFVAARAGAMVGVGELGTCTAERR
jgi:hypothetical protein